MRIRKRLMATAFVLGLLFSGTVFPGVETSLTIEPGQHLLGLPFEMKIEVVNRSEETVEVVWPRHMALVLQDPELWALPEEDKVLPPIGGFSAAVTITYEKLRPGDRVTYTLRSDQQITSLPRFCGPGRYRVGVKVPLRRPTGGQSTSDAWTKVEVVAPEDVDARAFAFLYGCEVAQDDGCGCSRKLIYGPPASAAAELLRRFPTSTYAAYAVWERWGKFRFDWKTPEDREATLSWLAKNPDEEYLTWQMPCTKDGQPDASVETRFMARQALNCRDRWLSAVLRNHPQIWFADEIRFKLAIDRYRLGESESAMAELEAIAKHSRPYVASKAGELLSAMKAKKMFEEKDK